MEKITRRLVNEMVKSNIIENDDDIIECYQYGLELIMTSLFVFLVMLVLSLFTKSTTECILFALFFCPLRAIAGGYHCQTFSSCFMMSLSIWIVYVILLISGIAEYSIPLLILYILSGVYIFINAPLEHPNNPLLPEEKTMSKKRVRILLIADTLICILFIAFKISYLSILCYSISASALLMLIGKNGGEYHNESNMSEDDG